MTTMPVVHQLRARAGRGNATAPNVLILTHVRERPPLYLFVEYLNADDADNIATRLKAVCAQAYQQARGSLTGGMLAVIRAASLTLKYARPSKSFHCGLSAILITNDEAILAQVEPAVCWLLREGHLARWPANSVWLDPEASDEMLRELDGGLTQDEPVEPDLTRIPLQPGDRLLLASSCVARHVGDLLIAESIAQEDPSAALHDLVPELDFSALSIAPDVEEVRPVQPVIPRPENTLADYVSLIKRTPAAQPLASAAEPAKPAAPDKEKYIPVSATSVDKYVFARTERPLPSPSAPEPPPKSPKHGPLPQARRREAGRSFSLPDLRPYLEIVVMGILFLFKLSWALVHSVLNLLARALPERERVPERRIAQVRRPVMQSNPMEGPVLVVLAVAIPLLVLLSVFILRSQSSAAQTARINELVNRATTTYQAALSIANADAKRAELLKASQLTEEALSLSPREATAKEIQAKIAAELDKLSNVTKFFFYPLLYDFKEKDSRPTTVLARGIDVYVLDSGLNRLYKFLLNDAKDGIQPVQNPVVMRQGDERGPIVIGRLTDIFWATSGGGRSGAGLLTLTASKQVVEYLPTKGINVLNLGTVTGWQEATVAESFNGNLYLLDAKANRILKFLPTAEDYKNPPVDYLAPDEKVDFAGAVDMAIDGFIYVLLADGTLMKFDTGHLLPFDKKGLDVPLRKPVAMVAQANSQSLWIADAGNRRIVQLNKNGEYQRQLKPDDPNVMNDLRGLSVDEVNRRFYFVNGNKLYMGSLQY